MAFIRRLLLLCSQRVVLVLRGDTGRPQMSDQESPQRRFGFVGVGNRFQEEPLQTIAHLALRNPYVLTLLSGQPCLFRAAFTRFAVPAYLMLKGRKKPADGPENQEQLKHE